MPIQVDLMFGKQSVMIGLLFGVVACGEKLPIQVTLDEDINGRNTSTINSALFATAEGLFDADGDGDVDDAGSRLILVGVDVDPEVFCQGFPSALPLGFLDDSALLFVDVVKTNLNSTTPPGFSREEVLTFVPGSLDVFRTFVQLEIREAGEPVVQALGNAQIELTDFVDGLNLTGSLSGAVQFFNGVDFQTVGLEAEFTNAAFCAPLVSTASNLFIP